MMKKAPLTFASVIFIILLLFCSCGGRDSKNPGYDYPVCLGDPFIMLYRDTYYVYGTGSKEGIVVYSSKDLLNWDKHAELALRMDDSYGDRRFWAPEVYHLNGRFYMYYSADRHICVAKSDSPLGPFVQDEKQPQMPDEECVDNTLLVDDDGQAYLYFDRFIDGLSIWVAELEDDLETIRPATLAKCISVSQPWEEVWARVNDGGFVMKHKDIYYMTYSANGYENLFYGIGYATASSPLGPWSKYANNPIYQKPEDLVGVGHSSMFRDKSGELRVVFHAHFDKDNIRPRIMCIADVWFTDEPIPELRIGGDIIRPKTMEPVRTY